MSADNWAVCPRCKFNRERKAKAILDAAQDQYGKVSGGRFMELVEAAQLEASSLTDIEQRALREDYEIGIGKDGAFEIDYRAECSDYDFKYTFQKAEQVEEVK